MGMFDTIVYECPRCGKNTEAQTKLAENGLRVYELGSKFPHQDGVLVLKDLCRECKGRNAMIIRDKEIVDFIPAEISVEESWGSLLYIDLAQRED